MKVIAQLLLAVILVTLVGCQTTRSKGGFSKKANTWDRKRGITDDDLPTPAWWYARRDYDPNFMHWGKMRHPDAKMKSEKWVMLNEDQCKAPHRSLGRTSADNGREYRFYGFFMEDRGYEPASDQLCPIFMLQKWELISSPKSKASTSTAAADQEGSNPPPPVPEEDEQAAPPVAAVPATNAVVQVKPKPVTAAKPAASAKKKVPTPTQSVP